MRIFLWVATIVFGYLAWTAGTLHEQTGDLAYLKQAIAWGIASVACVLIVVSRKSGKATGKKAKARG